MLNKSGHSLNYLYNKVSPMAAKRPKSNLKAKETQDSPAKEQLRAPDAKNRSDDDLELVNNYVCGQIKQLRKRKGWTLEQLSSLSGVSRSMLSQVERGAANPTLAVAFRIAQAFDVSLGDLVDGATRRPIIEVIRSDENVSVFRDDQTCRIRTLSPLNLEKDVEFYEVTLHAGESLESAAHFAGTREFLTVQQGKVRVKSGNESVEIKKGDSVQYMADVGHSITNLAKSDAVLFLVDIYAAER